MIKNNKEYTLIEVLQNIKEGEKYINTKGIYALKYITMKNGNLIFGHNSCYDEKLFVCTDNAFTKEEKYKEVNLENMFKYYNEGYRIKCTKDRISFFFDNKINKIYSTLEENFIDLAINGKWYVIEE
ncbi:hypothetical protein [Clostridium brassicae]|uniref:Uncharacterized protein n=1 Tax=Clostridium brassicae TaxID=2999072 RepID=A0ABT4D6A3_9CLOT|nr:hypothetical protein [Clostridium brassicae]MCY6957836.1 hypothetical protein [Clostridium brassicae]